MPSHCVMVVFRNLPSTCDGCGENFTIHHALSCNKDGLISQRHNEIRDFLIQLSSCAWSSVQREPILRESNDDVPELRADFLVRGIWSPQEVASFDVRVTETEAASYGLRSSDRVLRDAETDKKVKYQQACLERHISFTPLVCSVDGALGTQFGHFLKRFE